MMLCFSRDARCMWRQVPPPDSPRLPRRTPQLLSTSSHGTPPSRVGDASGATPTPSAKTREADHARGGLPHTPPCIAIHSNIDRPAAARLGHPSGPTEAPKSTHPTPPPTHSPQRTVVHMGRQKGCCHLGHRDEGCAATGGGRGRLTQQSNKGCRDGGPRGEVGRPNCQQCRASRSRHCHGQGGGGPGGGGQRGARGGEWSRAIKLGEAAGRRPHAQAAGPRLPPPSHPPRCRRATSPESRPADGSAPVWP